MVDSGVPRRGRDRSVSECRPCSGTAGSSDSGRAVRHVGAGYQRRAAGAERRLERSGDRLPDGGATAAPDAAGGAGLMGLGLVAALVALSLLATPRLGRRLRPAPGRRASPAFVFLLEHPG